MRWYLFGAQAAAMYGNPRVTADVDITVDRGPLAIEAIVEAFAEAGFSPRVRDAVELVETAHVLPVVHEPTGMPLDIVFAGSGMEAEFLERALVMSIEGVEMRIITPEDLIIAKVLAGRPKDLDDVRGVVKAQMPKLDMARVRDVLQLLEVALDQSDLCPVFERILSECRG
jgi:hypothetical protein